jgi:hypothetical protein
MSANAFRIIALNGLFLIIAGMFFGGFPLVWVVVREVYHGAAPVQLAGDYRGWTMAHLEGLLNGFMIIVLAAVTRIRPMSETSEKRFVLALLLSGWGNTVASVLAPALGVRGMQFDASPANNLITGLFTVALVGGIYSLVVAIRHLWPRID